MVRFSVFLNGEEVTSLNLESGREYFAGRSEDNDLVLGAYPGISRKHFKISEENGVWTVQVLSKFGELSRFGSKVSTVELNGKLSFQLDPYEFHCDMIEDHAGHAVESAEPAFDHHTRTNDFVNQADATRVGGLRMQPFVRIEQKGDSRELQLVGNLWTAGRDRNCEIVIEDQHASRRQFSITHTSEGFFITDLGSANGTQLNSKALPTNQAHPLRSGDVISALSARIYFEIHNPDFNRKLADLPLSALSEPVIEVPAESAGFEPSPGFSGYTPYNGFPPAYPPAPPIKKGFDWKKNRIRIVIGVLLVVIGGLYFMPENKKPVPVNAKEEAFNKLTNEQKLAIKDSYELARNLSGHRKWEMALAEIEKIHRMVPEYLESKTIEAETRRALELRAEEIAMEKTQRELEETRAKVEATVQDCRSRFTPRTMPDEIHTCLQTALEMDPENEGIKDLIAQAEQNQLEKERKEQAKEDYHRSVKVLENMCDKAEALNKSGELYQARKAFQRCLDSSLPDPKGLKNDAKRALASVNENVGKMYQEHMSTAEAAYQKGEFKKALSEIAMARRIDPENKSSAELFEKVDRDATNKMKLIYSDSVLEESLGQIDSAKEKWKKIIDLGLNESEFYKRAKRKLQRYGVM